MHWYARLGAFRAGKVSGTQWDDGSVGAYSFAVGYNPTASGLYSTAMGRTTTASGNYSTAMGSITTASGDYSTAMGNGTDASGSSSTAMGSNTIASGYLSIAMGYIATASGNYSTAMGRYVSTNGNTGSFIIGDASTAAVANSTAVDQMTMRFNGGYRLYSNTALTTGAYMNSGVNGWSNISDRNKKENFTSVDGELLLEKVSALPITEWNYKGTDKSIKYIGPMAQDFYSAFHLGGKDSLGINSIAIDGVNMAAIQALIIRTDELKIRNEKLEIRNKELEQKLVSQNELVQQLLTDLRDVKNAVLEIKKEKSGDSHQMASFITSTPRQVRSTEDSVTKE